MTVTVEGQTPRVLAFDAATYPHFAHGYALTIHKSQGATVERTYVLAGPNMDRHSAYVALSRHRDRVSLHWSKDVFPDAAALGRRLARRRIKDTTLDYREIVAEGVRAILTEARKQTVSLPEIDQWSRLYAAQRAEAERINTMSLVRRAFWMAANADRFLKAGALTLEKLHEHERSRLAGMLRETRKPAQPIAPSATKQHRPRLTPEAALGLSKTRPAVPPPPPRPMR